MNGQRVLKLPPLFQKQKEFCEAEGKYIGFGGARGGGKSHVARIKMILLAFQYPGIQILLLRRTLPELRTNHVIPLIKLLDAKNTNRNLRFAEYRDKDKEFRFPNGSRICLGYCENYLDSLQYQGQSFDAIFFEEATLFSEEIFISLKPSCRLSNQIQAGIKFTPRMYFTCNPGGVGHMWVKKLFIDNPECNKPGSGYVFIKSQVYDNEFLIDNDPDYVKLLESLPPKRKAAFLYGDWDVLEGQFFEEFDRDKHVIAPFPIPSNWKRYRARDYGFDMLAALWVAIDEKGNGYVYKEVHEPNLIVSLAGNRLNEVNNGDQLVLDLCPPDLFARNRVDYRSTVEIFQQDCGHYITKATNDRVGGWNAVREWLKDVEEEIECFDEKGEIVIKKITHPKLRVFSNCTNLIKYIPLLIYDEKNPNDASTQPHEVTHINDALRYFCASWTMNAVVPIQETQKNWTEKALEERYHEKMFGQNNLFGGYWD